MGSCIRKKLGVLLAAFVALVIFGAFMHPAKTQAAINPQINFQGKLTNPDGTNVTNGTYSIRFRIYNDPTLDAANACAANTCKWEETQASVSVTDGIFQVSLGSATTLPGSVDFNSSALYLGIKVGADLEMTPRIQLTASPYAFNSDKLGGISSTGYFQVGSAAAQTDASTNVGLFLNKTGSGNLIQLQNTAVDAFTVGNTGNLTLGQNAAKTISVAQTTTNAAGQNLTLFAGQGGAGAAANAGGNLVFQGGAGGGTNGNGGTITFAAGALNGSGAVGTVLVKNPSDSTTAFQIQNAGGVALFVVDASNTRIYVGNPVADAVATQLVLDNYTTASDPANGVNGAMYYNSGLHMYRCYRGLNATAADGAWEQCGVSEIARTFEISDEFMSGLTTSGNIGNQNWTLSTIGVCPAPAYNTTVLPTADRPGILKLITPATNGQGCTMDLNIGSWALAAGNTFLGGVAVGVATSPSQVIRVGLHNETTTITSPTTGVWWEADPASSLNWRYCYTNAVPATICAASSVAIAAITFVTLEARINTLGVGTSSADFFINGVRSSVSAITINTTNKVSPSLTCYASTALAQACYVDYLQFRGTTSAYR